MALAAVFAGSGGADASNWKFVRAVSLVSVAVFLMACAASLAVYGHSAPSAAMGLTSRVDYLRQRAPDYGHVEFVNQTLQRRESRGKTLAFMQYSSHEELTFFRDLMSAISPCGKNQADL